MKRRFLLVFVIFVSFFMLSCKQNSSINGNWETISLVKNDVEQEIALSNIEFKKFGKTATVNGNSGVNFFYGKVEVKNGNFKANDFAVTKRLGEPRANEFELLFLETLTNASSYTIENDILIISGENSILKFRKK